MYKAKIDNEIFDFKFNDQKGLDGTINGAAFKIDAKKHGSIHHVIHNHRSYTVEVVHFDTKNKSCICLLYTSPSPRDGLLSRMPSSA